ncbi:MAG: 23S rRNA (guanosine(2251)-2'-O)-methyltransferase RlmB [Spirochaetes bacterium]|nr:23S rRNA (guanosine(2251)-2'-O)-methyltransferase RlmB [Spirochaetota bacterium]
MENEKLIFGRNPVLEYLRGAAPGTVMELLIAENAHGKIIEAIIAAAREKKITPRYMGRDFFTGIGASARHQGVALRLHAGAHDARQGAAATLEKAAEKKGVIVLMDHITDPHNAGSIIRTAEALGCSGIVIPGSHASGVTPTVVKSSAGATAHVEIVQVSNVSFFLEEAKKRGFWIIGTADQGATSLKELPAVRPCVVVIGSEDAGMRRLTAERCDFIVRIPLAGRISSLNASVAAGIVLYEVMNRQPDL